MCYFLIACNTFVSCHVWVYFGPHFWYSQRPCKQLKTSVHLKSLTSCRIPLLTWASELQRFIHTRLFSRAEKLLTDISVFHDSVTAVCVHMRSVGTGKEFTMVAPSTVTTMICSRRFYNSQVFFTIPPSTHQSQVFVFKMWFWHT